MRIYGAGIVSSKGESIYSIDSPAPNRVGFDLERVMSTRYRIDTFQQTYFVIDDFAQLFEATRRTSPRSTRSCRRTARTSAGDVLPGERTFAI